VAGLGVEIYEDCWAKIELARAWKRFQLSVTALATMAFPQ
jgi:hypothetical protein